jgi:hypothetical protein
MSVAPIDIEFSKYWPLLSTVQKQSLLEVVKSFLPIEGLTIPQYNQELSEAEEEYNAGNHITSEEMIKLIRQW